MGPITNYELGKMLHREYEAEASRYWGLEVTNEDKPGPRKVYRLALASTIIVLIMLVGCRVAPAETTAAEVVEVAATTTHAIKAEPVLITQRDKRRELGKHR